MILRLLCVTACLVLASCAYESGPPDNSRVPRNAPDSLLVPPLHGAMTSIG